MKRNGENENGDVGRGGVMEGFKGEQQCGARVTMGMRCRRFSLTSCDGCSTIIPTTTPHLSGSRGGAMWHQLSSSPLQASIALPVSLSQWGMLHAGRRQTVNQNMLLISTSL